MFEGLIGPEDRIKGGIGIGVMGVRVSELVPASMQKLSPVAGETGPVEQEQALRSVLDDLDHGQLTEARYSKAAAANIRKGLEPKGKLVAVGLPTSLLYLGSIRHRRPEEQNEKNVTVYEVRSPSKKTLCGISLDEKGLVGDFMCAIGEQMPGS